MRIIGVELRSSVSTERGRTIQREAAILPLDLTIKVDEQTTGRIEDANINGTIHTDFGDLNFAVNVPVSYFTDKTEKEGMTIEKTTF